MKSLHINLDQLVTFYYVAKERSLSRASEKLCVTVPAVAKQIKSLEAFFRVKIITVRKKQVYLTNMGTMLFPLAEEVYHAAIKAESLLLGGKDNLRIGVSFGLTRRFLAILDRFKAIHPPISVTVREGPSLRLVSELLEFQHDLCIVATPSTLSSELRAFRVPRPYKMLLVAAPGSLLTRKREVKWEDLNNYPVVLHGEGSLSRKLVLEEFQKRNVKPFIAASLDSIEVINELVHQGAGVTFTPPWTVADDLAAKKLQVVHIKGGEVELWMDIVVHKRVIQTSACKAFLGLIGEEFGCAFEVD